MFCYQAVVRFWVDVSVQCVRHYYVSDTAVMVVQRVSFYRSLLTALFFC